MERGAAPSHRHIHRQNAIRKCGQNVSIHPCMQYRTLFRSRCSRGKIPISSSRTEMTERWRRAAGSASAQARTLGSACFAFLNSETTLVSTRYITTNPLARANRLSDEGAQTQCEPWSPTEWKPVHFGLSINSRSTVHPFPTGGNHPPLMRACRLAFFGDLKPEHAQRYALLVHS
jgi:hypothetical protein